MLKEYEVGFHFRCIVVHAVLKRYVCVEFMFVFYIVYCLCLEFFYWY